jgi:hypothetical protein
MARREFARGPSIFQRSFRELGHALGYFVFPHALIDEREGLSGAEKLILDGYGLMVVINHFSKRDGIQAAISMCDNRVFKKKPILLPIGLHQFEQHREVQVLAPISGVQLMPISTRNTVEFVSEEYGEMEDWPEEIIERYERGKGMREYMDGAVQMVNAGGIVIVAAQGRRRESLGEAPEEHTMGALLAYGWGRIDIDRVAILCVGLSIPGETDYSEENAGGLNWRRLYEIRVGNVNTLKQALSSAYGKDVGGELDPKEYREARRQFDQWVYSQLRELVPEEYGGQG